MVFNLRGLFTILSEQSCIIAAPQRSVATGIVGKRNTADHIVSLVIESSFAMTIALSNLFIIAIMVAGFEKLLKVTSRNLYSLKHMVSEQLLHYFGQFNLLHLAESTRRVRIRCSLLCDPTRRTANGDSPRKTFTDIFLYYQVMGYFSLTYEWVFFNLSVFADYGMFLVLLRHFIIDFRRSVFLIADCTKPVFFYDSTKWCNWQAKVIRKQQNNSSRIQLQISDWKRVHRVWQCGSVQP